jgi:hypothetical protein
VPWASKRQARWGHSPAGLAALGGQQKVAEWDQATTPGSLPEESGKLARAAARHRKRTAEGGQNGR